MRRMIILAALSLPPLSLMYVIGLAMADEIEAIARDDRPAFDVALFYRDDKIVPGRVHEFVVKIHNDTTEGIEVVYGPLRTHVLDSQFRSVEPSDQWYLRLVVKIESDIPAIDLSGQILPPLRVGVPSEGYTLVLFTPRDKFLPGERLRVWAELRSPEGEVYRSNEVSLHREK